MKKYILLLLIILLTSAANAKPYHKWVKTDVSDGLSLTTDVCYDNEGNIWTAGIFKKNITISGKKYEARGGKDAYIKKITPEGNTVFAWIFSGVDSSDTITSIHSDESGVYVAGYSAFGTLLDAKTELVMDYESVEIEKPDTLGYIAKYSFQGELLWYKSFINLDVSAITSNRDRLYIASKTKGHFIIDSTFSLFGYYIGILEIDKKDYSKNIFYYSDSMLYGDMIDIAVYQNTIYMLMNLLLQKDDEVLVIPIIQKAVYFVYEQTIEFQNGIIGTNSEYGNGDLNLNLKSIALNDDGQPRVVGYYSDSLYFVDDFGEYILETDSKNEAGFVLGLTSDLKIQWHHKLDNEGPDMIESIAITEDDEIIIGGATSVNDSHETENHNRYANHIEKLDHDGNSYWSITSVISTKDSNIANYGVLDLATKKGTGRESEIDNIIAVGALGKEAIFGSDTITNENSTLQNYTWKIADNPNYGILKTRKQTVTVNDSCNIPIIFEGVLANNTKNDITGNIEFELTYNSTMLFPADYENKENNISEMFVDDKARRHVRYKFENLTIDNNSSIVELPYIVGWGNDTETEIGLDLISFETSVDIEIDEVLNGKITIDGIPDYEGDDILIEPQGVVGVMSIFPNPIDDKGTMQIESLREVTGNCYVINSKGIVVKELGNINLQKDTSFNSNFYAEQLSIGTYWLVVEFDDFKPLIEKFEVIR